MTLSQLQSRVRYVLGELSTSNYSDDNITSSLNDYLKRATAIAIRACGEWEVSEEIARTNITAGQSNYSFPSDLISLKRIEINLTGETNAWQVARIRDLRNVTVAVTNDDPLGEIDIDLYGNRIFFLNTPATDVTAGIRIFYSDDATNLVDSTDSPILAEECQPYMVYGAAFDYSIARGLETDYKKFQDLLDRTERKINESYTNRLPAKKTTLTTIINNYE